MFVPATPIDALTSPTLKHLREDWWNDEFTEFLTETLRPRAGNRILDVGCGGGQAQISIGRMRVSQIRMYGVDLRLSEAVLAARVTASHNISARFAAGDARRLPFVDDAFDSTYCVAVLQHIHDIEAAIREIARVTRDGGRIVAVEPDNAARYAYSSAPSGATAFSLAAEYFAAVAAMHGTPTEQTIGPRLPELFGAHGIDTVMVRVFPVSNARLGTPPAEVWKARRAAIEHLMTDATDEVRTLGRAQLAALDQYEREARAMGHAFVEIQSTLLFAAVGQRSA